MYIDKSPSPAAQPPCILPQTSIVAGKIHNKRVLFSILTFSSVYSHRAKKKKVKLWHLKVAKSIVGIMFMIIKSAFMQRRKTLLNALTNTQVFASKQEGLKILKKLNLDENVRAENLSIQDYANIAKEIL